jgi:hypothetical protein
MGSLTGSLSFYAFFYGSFCDGYHVKKCNIPDEEEALRIKKAFKISNVPSAVVKTKKNGYILVDRVKYTKEQAKLVIDNLISLMDEK